MFCVTIIVTATVEIVIQVSYSRFDSGNLLVLNHGKLTFTHTIPVHNELLR
jgi:hypothetical protein